MTGIMWLLSGFNKSDWLKTNLDFLITFIKNRPQDKIFIVSNGDDIKPIIDGYDYPIEFCQVNYNRGTPNRMDYGSVDLFHHTNYYANIMDNDDITHVVNFHWDIIIHSPDVILELCEQLDKEDKDIATYYRTVNIEMNEAVCPHGWLLIMKKHLITEHQFLDTLPVYEESNWGIERAMLYWLLRYYKCDALYPEHPKIINLGLIDYYTTELTHIHLHDWDELQRQLHVFE